MGLVEIFAAMTDEEAEEALLRCCASRRWVQGMMAARPFWSAAELFATADRVWEGLPERDWQEAFSGHPRIGDVSELRRKFASTEAWAKGEQAGVAAASEETLQGLASGNAEYEKRFGYIFIICASGLQAHEMLEALRKRLGNEPEDELRIAGAEQAKITRIRLGKLETLAKDEKKERTSMKGPITTHVLDTAKGMPAEGVPVRLEFAPSLGAGPEATAWKSLGSGTTDKDGRVSDLLAPGAALAKGFYRITFSTAEYFTKGGVEGFYPYASIVFEIRKPAAHYHVPLLLSPFGYSTYRGS